MLWSGPWACLFYKAPQDCKEQANIYCNTALQARELWEKPKSLCAIAVFVCVWGLLTKWNPVRQRRIKRISGEDWKRLIKAHATNSLMNSLTPSAEVNSCFPNPLLVLSACGPHHVIGSVYQCPKSHKLHLAKTQSGNLWPMAPLDTCSNMATQIMLNPQREGSSRVIF